MKNFNLYIALNLGFTLILAASCSKSENQGNSSRVEALPYYNSAEFTPNWFTKNSDSLINFHRIPAFKLVNQFGDTISEKTFKNKTYIADFFFTSCPGICPKMTKNMSLVQDAFKDDASVMLLSHSVTPETDSVAALKKYAERNGCINGKWHLATGERKAIYNLGRNFYFVEEDLGLQKGENDFLHTENFVLVDRNRQIRGIYNGLNSASIAQLIADVKTLKKEMEVYATE